MRNVVFVTPFPGNAMENVRAAASLDDVRSWTDAEAAITELGLPVVVKPLAGPCVCALPRDISGPAWSDAIDLCDSYEGDGYIIVRHPETEVVLAAMRTITETIAIEYA